MKKKWHNVAAGTIECMEIFGVSTLAVLNNVDLALNLVNGTSCYVTNKYNYNLAFFFPPSLQNVSAG